MQKTITPLNKTDLKTSFSKLNESKIEATLSQNHPEYHNSLQTIGAKVNNQYVEMYLS